MKQITIGDKPLMKISPEDLLQLAVIQGCCGCLDFWDYPVIVDFCDTMFSDRIVIQYKSTNKEDGRESDTIVFFFHTGDPTFHYHRERERDQYFINRFEIKAIKFLIEKGYDIPIY